MVETQKERLTEIDGIGADLSAKIITLVQMRLLRTRWEY